MIKRILGIVLCLSLVFSLCSFADEVENTYKIEVCDANNDKILVFGNTTPGSGVTLTVFYPGYSSENLSLDNYTQMTKAVAFADGIITKDGEFAFEFKLKDNASGGGIFKFQLNFSNEEKVNDYEFYFYEKKLQVIEKFNNPGEEKEEDILKDAIKTYSFSADTLWTEGNAAKILTALQNIKNSLVEDEFSADPTSFNGYLKTALLMGAINASDRELVLEDGDFRKEIISFFDEEDVKEYKDNINESGKEKLIADFLDEKYNLTEDANKYFKELCAFYLISAYKDKGYGHIADYLEKYAEVYDDAGFKLDKFEKLTESNKNKFLAAFMKEKSNNLDAMADDFNNTFNTYAKKESSSSSGGSSSGSGSSSGGSFGGSGKVTTDITGTEGLIDPSVYSAVFDDIENVAWAQEAIKELYDRGIVSGYGDGQFRPNASVTRAEFTKMISGLIKEDSKIKVATVGDSLTQGLFDDTGKYSTAISYGTYLQEYLGDDYEVKNFGRSSHGLYDKHEYYYRNTEEYKAVLEYKPDIAVIVIGSNDMKVQYWDLVRDDYYNIYKTFIKEFLDMGTTVICGIPTPVYEGPYLADRPIEYRLEIGSIEKEVAKELGITLVDTYTLMDGKPELFPDGTHFNKEGGKIFGRAFADAIMEKADIKFDDVSENDWFYDSVMKASGINLVRGSNGKFNPSATITREDASVIIYRMVTKYADFYKEKGFEDEKDVSEYALEAVRRLGGVNIISGMGEGYFMPKNTLTRAQAAVLIYGMLDYIEE